MLQIRKAILALTMIACASMNAMQLTHKGNDFFVDNTKIERAFIDKELRGIDNVKLAQYAAAGARLKLAKLNDSNDYALHLDGRLNGGGPIVGKAAFWVTKVGGITGWAVVCFFHPAHAAETMHVLQAIEGAAIAAEVVGNIIPGP